MTLPKISNYGEYSSDNYGKHSLKVELPTHTIYFSYETVIAFRVNGNLYVHENDWGTTTGKHLNWIDGGSKEAKKSRLTDSEFKAKYNELCN